MDQRAPIAAFQPFSIDHAVALAWTLPLMIGACWLGRRWCRRGQDAREMTLAAAWAGFVVCVNVWNLVYWFLPANYDPNNSWPLQLCDLACLVAPLALLPLASGAGPQAERLGRAAGGLRWARTLLYFWGIGLSTQAFVTPTLRETAADMQYWLFWLVHVAIVGSAVYDVVVRGYRPSRRDWMFGAGVTLAYGAVVFTLNILTGANYGYVGNTTPENRTIVDALGPWPQRVGIMVVIVMALQAALWAVWQISPATRGGGGGRGDDA